MSSGQGSGPFGPRYDTINKLQRAANAQQAAATTKRAAGGGTTGTPTRTIPTVKSIALTPELLSEEILKTFLHELENKHQIVLSTTAKAEFRQALSPEAIRGAAFKKKVTKAEARAVGGTLKVSADEIITNALNLLCTVTQSHYQPQSGGVNKFALANNADNFKALNAAYLAVIRELQAKYTYNGRPATLHDKLVSTVTARPAAATTVARAASALPPVPVPSLPVLTTPMPEPTPEPIPAPKPVPPPAPETEPEAVAPAATKTLQTWMHNFWNEVIDRILETNISATFRSKEQFVTWIESLWPLLYAGMDQFMKNHRMLSLHELKAVSDEVYWAAPVTAEQDPWLLVVALQILGQAIGEKFPDERERGKAMQLYTVLCEAVRAAHKEIYRRIRPEQISFQLAWFGAAHYPTLPAHANASKMFAGPVPKGAPVPIVPPLPPPSRASTLFSPVAKGAVPPTKPPPLPPSREPKRVIGPNGQPLPPGMQPPPGM